MMQYEIPIRIGTMELSGRIVMPPMATRKCKSDGSVTDDLIAYYVERAKRSKVSLILVEYAYTSIEGRAYKGQMSLASDANEAQLRKLTTALHENQVKVMAQINHAGMRASYAENGVQAIGPSVVAVSNDSQNPVCRAMYQEDIDRVVQEYVDASKRAQACGFDGVEIHCAHGYLYNQFYSPLTNHRTDQYGRQNIENATRIACETIRAVREALGSEYPIAIRLGGIDDTEGGSTVQDCVQACLLFEQAGVDLIDLTGGMTGYTRKDVNTYGYFKDMSIPVKQAVSIPVLLTGGVKRLEEVEDLLVQDTCDLVGVGRAMLTNPTWYE